mmetsp:Transcript_80994/g.161518  ORF Transcript_80994/g.161518 Transcript_80994/m.161518 type:complete len:432 (-) Transcript_80994:296-1591(-)
MMAVSKMSALRVFYMLTLLVNQTSAQTLAINALAGVPNQWDDVPITWISTDMDVTAQVEFRRCESAPTAGCANCIQYSSGVNTLNDGMTTLITTSTYPWTVTQGPMYICMVSSTDSNVFSATAEFTIPTPTLIALKVGPSNRAQYDEITLEWASTGLGEAASISMYRCTEVPDATVNCADNTKCVYISAEDNVGFLRLESDYNDDYTQHVDDTYPYKAGWTTDAGTFHVCMFLSQAMPAGTAVDPIFQYSAAYAVSAPSLDLERPNSKSCYDPFETVSVKWSGKGGGEKLNLFKCKSRASSKALVTCEDHPDCSALSPSNQYAKNSGFAYVASTAKGDLTGASGMYYLCAASDSASDQLYSYSGKYTVSDDENACPLNDGEIAGVAIGCFIIFACLVGACYFAWKKYGSGGDSSSMTTTKDPPVVLANVYE